MEDMYIAYIKIAAYIGAAFVMGIGTIGPALGQGLVASKAVENLPKSPENYAQIRTLMFLGMSIIETLPLYALLVAIVLIFLS